ncbi:prenyltransferase/squalene oxidase repeat-containing protein [Kitasatospora fiedleri]|uniref:prenyltransferase/squalene oxidase repeat-containing protein n=1 Tax=Kitasatospora fiedleri TaxID=2991545 RepID=UPI00384F28A1
MALLRAGTTVPAAALDRFTTLQCADGGISGAMIAAGDHCESDPSTTSLTVLALNAAGGRGATVDKAVGQLTASQQTDGSYLPYVGASSGDTSSTAMAAQGLKAAGRTTGGAAATAWIATRQNPDGGFATDEWTPDSDPAATEQAILALTGTDPLTVTHDLGTAPQPGRTPDLAKGGAYLTDPARLLGGHYYEAFPDSGFADFGLTIDAAYALAATGTDDAALRRIVDFLDQQGKDGNERTVNDWTSVGTEYVGGGSVGKEALLAEVVGRDPRNFGGHDLIAALAQAVCDHADAANGCAAEGNYLWATSVFSQSLGVMAQLRAGDAEHAAAPIAYLKGLQAANGSWPSLIPASGDSDVDSTAMAVMALALVPGDEAARAVDKGLAWLAAQQLPDGGFPGAAGDSTNSAALAIQGLTLRQSAHAAQIARAVEFLAAEQNADGGFNVASAGQQGSDVRASTQTLGGVTGLSFGTLHRDLGGDTPTGSPSPSPSDSASPSPSPSPSVSAPPSDSPSAPSSPSVTASGGSVPPTSSTTGAGAGTGAGQVPPGSDTGSGSDTGTASDSLAWTGTDVLELVVPGLLLTAAGGAVLVATADATPRPRAGTGDPPARRARRIRLCRPRPRPGRPRPGATPAAATALPIEQCTTTSGVVLAVDFSHWGGPLLRSCGTTPTTGYQLLNQGGWKTTGTQHDGPAFICRIGYSGHQGGTQYPTRPRRSASSPRPPPRTGRTGTPTRARTPGPTASWGR